MIQYERGDIMKKLFLSAILLLSFTGACLHAEEKVYLTVNGIYGQANQTSALAFDGAFAYGLGFDTKAFLTDFVGISVGINWNMMFASWNQVNDLLMLDVYLGVPIKPFDNGHLIFTVTPCVGCNLYSNDIIGFLFFLDDSMDTDFVGVWFGGEVSGTIMLGDSVGISVSDQLEYLGMGIGSTRPFPEMNRWSNQLKVGLTFSLD